MRVPGWTRTDKPVPAPPKRKRDKRSGGKVQFARRDEGTGTLVLNVRRDPKGRAVPEWLDDEGKPRWRFTGRRGPGKGNSRTFLERGWQDADLAMKKFFDEDRAIERPKGEKRMSDLFTEFETLVRGEDSDAGAMAVAGYMRQIALHIRPAFGDARVAEVTSEQVTEWKSGLTGADESRRKIVSLLWRLFEVAIEHRWITWNPVRIGKRGLPGAHKVKVKSQDGGRALEAASVEAIVEKIAEVRGELDPGAAMAVRLAAACGFRREELVHLRRDAVSPDGRVIRVVAVDCGCDRCRRRGEPWTGKSEAALRPALVPPGVLGDFREYLAVRDARFPASPWLLPVFLRERNHWPGGAQRSVEWAPADFIEARDALVADMPDLRGATLHDLRHTAKTRLTDRCGHKIAVDIVTGHELDKMDRTYVHLRKEPERLYAIVFGEVVEVAAA